MKKSAPKSTLADGHEETQWAWVPVLEEVQSHAALRGQLVRHLLARLAAAGSHNVAVAGLKLEVVEVAGNLWHAVVGGLLSSGRLQLVTAHAARAGVVVVGSLEVLLLREEEDDGASLALVIIWDVKVEDAARGAVDLAKVRGAIALVGRVLVDWNDEVRGLVRSLVQSGCASLAVAAVATVAGVGARWLSCGGSLAALVIALGLSGLCRLSALSGLLVGLGGLVAVVHGLSALSWLLVRLGSLVAVFLGLSALSWLLIRLGLGLIGSSGHSRCAALVTTVAPLGLAGARSRSLRGRGDKSQAAASRDAAGAVRVGVGRVASISGGLCRGRRLTTIAALRLGRSGSGALGSSGALVATIVAAVATAVAATIALALAAGAQRDLGALVLAIDLLGVDVVLVLISWAGVESVVPIVPKLTVARDGKATVRRGSHVALELGGRWREDTSAT